MRAMVRTAMSFRRITDRVSRDRPNGAPNCGSFTTGTAMICSNGVVTTSPTQALPERVQVTTRPGRYTTSSVGRSASAGSTSAIVNAAANRLVR